MNELKNKILLKKYKIIKRIGKGAFGSVFIGKNIYKDEYIAIKLELKNQTDAILERETYILHMLKGFGIPRVISYGHNSKFNILIQELLGKSLDKLFKKNKKLSLKDSCMIGVQILDRLEYIHDKNIIHRDIKADNFLIGLKDSETIYIIDFGLAKQYRNIKTGKHVKYCINKKWSGTSRFASANTLRGIEPSRRDDMESFCYLLLYLMKGTLPWDKINETSEFNEILMIYKMKQYMPADIMFKELPSQMNDFYKYCKNLNFEQRPNYGYLRKLLINILEFIGEKNDLYFSWIIHNSLNKRKNGDIKKLKQINKNNKKINGTKKLLNESIKTNKKKEKYEFNNILHSKKFSQSKNKNSLEKINKGNNINFQFKKNVLGYCNIIKRKYIKSQSPNVKRVITKNENNRKRIDEKKNVIIDLTDFIENKKAKEIKSYKTKILNYKAIEKNKMIKDKSQDKEKNINFSAERRISKRNMLDKNSKNRPIMNVSTYSINNLSSLKLRNDNTRTNSNEIYLEKKAISPIYSKKNNRLNLLDITKNEINSIIKEKKSHSNSFLKELFLTNNKKNNDINILGFGKLNNNGPKWKKNSFSFKFHKFKNIIENGSVIYNKKILKTKSGFIINKIKNSEIIKHKLTDNGISSARKCN